MMGSQTADIQTNVEMNCPLTSKENVKRVFRREKPEWIPCNARETSDMLLFTPRIHPDNVVGHGIHDGEPPYEYTSNRMISNWYDLDWEYVPVAKGATVYPGEPKVPDICEWEKYITLPDVAAMDWEGCKKANAEYCNSDKFVVLEIMCGFWERLMALMDVENAAVALIMEDEQEGVHRFLDKHTDILIEYVDRMTQIVPFDSVVIHDDWGHQRGSFFSADTCREMIVPYLKRFVDFCHSKGLIFELHCCGVNEMNVPCMIEAGVDYWAGQEVINDFDKLLEEYKDAPIVFGVTPDPIPEGTPDEEIIEIAKQWVHKYKDKNIILGGRGPSPVFLRTVYEYSKQLFAEEK